jgi:hypothetical protein
MVRSSAVRRTVFGHLSRKAKEAEAARRAEAIATVVAVAEATDEAAISKTMRRVNTVLHKHQGDMSRSDLRSEVGSAYRAHLPEALARLELVNTIITSETRVKIK